MTIRERVSDPEHGSAEIFPTEMQRGKDIAPVSTPRISKNRATMSKAKYTCDEKYTCTCNTTRQK